MIIGILPEHNAEKILGPSSWITAGEENVIYNAVIFTIKPYLPIWWGTLVFNEETCNKLKNLAKIYGELHVQQSYFDINQSDSIVIIVTEDSISYSSFLKIKYSDTKEINLLKKKVNSLYSKKAYKELFYLSEFIIMRLADSNQTLLEFINKTHNTNYKEIYCSQLTYLWLVERLALNKLNKVSFFNLSPDFIEYKYLYVKNDI